VEKPEWQLQLILSTRQDGAPLSGRVEVNKGNALGGTSIWLAEISIGSLKMTSPVNC
jgi:hypothetical protein